MTPMTLGEKIKQLRQEKGYSQTFLEKRSGVNSKLLSKYENGRIIPTADTLRKLAEGLDISADYLIFDNVPKDGRCQLKDLELQLILEPGRVLVGNAGILVTEVLYRKSGEVKNFIIVDAGMNDLMRPTLYNAFHAIEPVVNSQSDVIVADVVGPICESGDFLAVDRSISNVQSGDLLAVMSAGAYGYVMSSNYCSRPRVAEVMVKGDRFNIVKAREGYEDLVRGETVPTFLKNA